SFELSYKGKEAGTLLLQLTYHSNDPTHKTYKPNRPSYSGTGAPARRSIYPTKKTQNEEKPEEVEEEHVDEGPVYKPPVVEPTTPQVPMVPGAVGYPYGTLPAGGPHPLSPSATQTHFTGHHTPQVSPSAIPYGTPAVPAASPYAPGFGGYPTAAGVYPDPNLVADINKRHSFNGQQPPVQPGGFLPGYPGAPPVQQQPVVGGFPPQIGAGGIYPPTPSIPANSPYPLANPLPIAGAGGPPAGYPFAASGIYPANSNNSSNGPPSFPGSNTGGYPNAFPGNNNNTGPYNNNGGINNHSNGNLNNFNGGNNGGNSSNNSGGGYSPAPKKTNTITPSQVPAAQARPGLMFLPDEF
ncbi:hypothetical protein BGZ76_004568, partial [Entomortierella beljakovae]